MTKPTLFWSRSNLYGLDYATLKANWNDFNFEIRYDCDQIDSTVKPKKCGCYLNISFMGKPITSTTCNENSGQQMAVEFVSDFINKYKTY